MDHDRLPDLPPDLKSLAADLAMLAPACGALSRDELMYRAGWEARSASAAEEPLSSPPRARAEPFQSCRSPWLWPLSTAGLILIATTLGIALATRSPEVHVVYIEKPVRSAAEPRDSTQPAGRTVSPRNALAAAQNRQPSSARLDPWAWVGAGHEYFSLRQRVLAFGVDGLESRKQTPSLTDDPAASDSRYGTLLGQLRGG
jgi:hypothetical protein